ncbi:hypothetical protein HK405_008169, partial [Cladochytrium tenue]
MILAAGRLARQRVAAAAAAGAAAWRPCQRTSSAVLATGLVSSPVAAASASAGLATPFAAVAKGACRALATSSGDGPESEPAELSALRLQTTLTTTPRAVPANKDLVFGRTFSDHMLTVEWQAGRGWDAPRLQPYGKIALEPSATVFHYAVECFEGMKAYKDRDGNIRMFRPDMNMDRLWKSCKRLSLPTFDKEQLLEAIKALLRVDQRWIPAERGYSLYLRPTAIATQESLGVGPSSKALLFVIASPVGPYYKTGFAAVSLSATSHYVRAWPGGTGDSKIGANYAPGIRPQIEVAKDGFQQNLWLFGPEDRLTEVGTMNLFVYWRLPNGEVELVTPPLDGTILPGVTRDSILAIARDTWRGEFKVSERVVTMPEVVRAVDEGRMLEMFGAGTAAIVSPIKLIRYKDRDVVIPLDRDDPAQQAGPLTRRLADYIMGVQYGEIPHGNWSVVYLDDFSGGATAPTAGSGSTTKDAAAAATDAADADPLGDQLAAELEREMERLLLGLGDGADGAAGEGVTGAAPADLGATMERLASTVRGLQEAYGGAAAAAGEDVAAAAAAKAGKQRAAATPLSASAPAGASFQSTVAATMSQLRDSSEKVEAQVAEGSVLGEFDESGMEAMMKDLEQMMGGA